MFLNPIWSVLLLVMCVAIYFVYMRPRLKLVAPMIYDEFDSAWAQAWAVVVHFKATVVLIIGIIITAAPDLLVQIAPIDFSKWLPEPWAAFTSPACFILITLLRAYDARKGT